MIKKKKKILLKLSSFWNFRLWKMLGFVDLICTAILFLLINSSVIFCSFFSLFSNRTICKFINWNFVVSISKEWKCFFCFFSYKNAINNIDYQNVKPYKYLKILVIGNKLFWRRLLLIWLTQVVNSIWCGTSKHMYLHICFEW